MEKETYDLFTRHENDFTSREGTEFCVTCKNCRHRSDGTSWSNHYKKGFCAKYRFPHSKPVSVIHYGGSCEWYEAE